MICELATVNDRGAAMPLSLPIAVGLLPVLASLINTGFFCPNHCLTFQAFVMLWQSTLPSTMSFS